MLRTIIYVTMMSVMTCRVVRGCYFYNCPNEFSWSKKNDDNSALMRMVVGNSQRFGDPKKLLQCYDQSEDRGFPRCEFRGTSVCCGSDVYGSRDCDAYSTETEALGEGVLRRIQQALQVYMDSADPEKFADRRLCVKVGICCNGERCKPKISCELTPTDEYKGQSSMKKINNLIKDLLKSDLSK